MRRWIHFAMLAPLLFLAARPGEAALLSLSVIHGLTALDGSGVIPEGLPQESLSGSTLTQLGGPLLFDPASGFPWSLSVRLTNISDLAINFPDALPGVSVLTGVYGISGYTARQNVAAGGNRGANEAPGAEGAISRTVVDLTGPLEAVGTPASGSNGGGGGAATGVADNWIALTGASGADLALYLAGVTLNPGEWVDIADFVRIAAFSRHDDAARIALGFDIPTFSFGGVSITTGAWTGSFTGPAATEPEEPPVAASEPGTLALAAAGLGLVLARGRRRFRALADRGEDLPRERR